VATALYKRFNGKNIQQIFRLRKSSRSALIFGRKSAVIAFILCYITGAFNQLSFFGLGESARNILKIRSQF